jgi:transposase
VWHPRRIARQHDYTLTESELVTIEQAIKNDLDLRLRQRAQIIRLLHKGHKLKAIADLLSISTGPVYYWHNRWRQQGLEWLRDQRRSGRPSVADETYRQKLVEVPEIEPQVLGLAFTVWTPARLLAYLEQETGVVLPENTLRNLFKELDYVYQQPKHDLDFIVC